MSFGDVVSSNIVGYQTQTPTHSYYDISAANFIPVSGAKVIRLGDIKPNDEIISSYITFVTQTGATPSTDFKGTSVKEKYVYWFAADLGPGQEEGWYLEDDGDCEICKNDVEIPFGDGFMFFKDGGDGAVSLTFSGAVASEPTTKSFSHSYYSISGNCSPVDITLGDITPNDEIISSYITFVTQTGATPTTSFKGGTVKEKYVYWFEADLEPGKAPGWYLEDDADCEECKNDVVIKAGQGFLFFKDVGDGDVTITIPSAL